MATQSVPTRYGTATIVLHWSMLVLLAAVYACIELRELQPRGSEARALLKTWHFVLGLAVFGLVWVRLLARWRGGAPAIVLPAWQAWASRLVHGLLYLFMLAMPLLGWASLGAEGKPVLLFGWPLPALLAADPALAEGLEEWHETLGVAGYWLIGLHAAAALFHHFLLRDATLRRMWPGRN